MSETVIISTVIGTWAAATSILLTVLLTVMTMQGRAINSRIDDQNRRFDDLRQHMDKRFDDQNEMIRGRFEDQNQRIADLVFETRNDRQAATG